MSALTGCSEIDTSTSEWIIGSDEAGYGTWAGSLVVVGVAVKRGWSDPAVKDSKQLKDKARVAIIRQYRSTVVWEKVLVFPQEIDEKGVWTSVIQAHNCVHQALAKRVEGTVLHIVDGLENAKRLLMPGLVPLSKADVYIPAVSLASCFAKTIQCVLMDKAEKDFPGYGFGTHRGYGTPQHKAALETLGICPIHRKSYGPVKSLLQQTDPNLWESGSDLTSERSIL